MVSYVEKGNHHDEDSGEAKEKIEIIVSGLRTYVVTLSYFESDTANELSDDVQISSSCDKHALEVIVSRYEVTASSIEDAIDKTMVIHKCRRMETITGYPLALGDAIADGKVKGVTNIDEIIPMLLSFRDWMVDEGNFAEFYMQEPTSIQVHLKENESLLRNKTIANVVRDTDSTGDKVENWLKDQTEKDGDE